MRGKRPGRRRSITLPRLQVYLFDLPPLEEFLISQASSAFQRSAAPVAFDRLPSFPKTEASPYTHHHLPPRCAQAEVTWRGGTVSNNCPPGEVILYRIS